MCRRRSAQVPGLWFLLRTKSSTRLSVHMRPRTTASNSTRRGQKQQYESVWQVGRPTVGESVPESGHVLHGDLVVLVLDQRRRLEVQDLLEALPNVESHLNPSRVEQRGTGQSARKNSAQVVKLKSFLFR